MTPGRIFPRTAEVSLWRDAAPAPGDARFAGPLPRAVDVVVIGSGYTGLNAAIEIARGGREVLVVEAGDPGQGCSTRNGGQIGTCIKPSLEKLSARFGADRARAIRGEGVTALRWIEARIADLAIDCDFRCAGRFHAAHSPAAYAALAADAERVMRTEGIEAHPVPRAEQARELGTTFYHGGVVYPAHARVHPGKLLAGFLASALAAGATVIGNCAATGIVRDGTGYRIATAMGSIRAGEVVVASNGYTGAATPWLRRRVIPIGSSVIATEPLAPDLIDRLFPTARVISDTRRVVYYYSASPDRRRVVFGGRVAAGEISPAVSGPRLHSEMARIFPDLARTRIAHSWSGSVAYTFDTLPHIGRQDGIRYALGYCGSGVGMASYLGMRLGQQVLGLAEGRTAFDGLPFPTRPFYTGRPWFLPAAVAWYRLRDRLETARAG